MNSNGAPVENEAAPKPGFLARTFLSLQYRDYRLLWLGSITEHAGEWMEGLALTWLVWERTHSTFSVALITTCRGLPLLLVPFLGGMAADRFDRRHLLRLTLLAMALGSLVILLLNQAGALLTWYIYVYALVAGCITGFNHPTRATLLPNLVKREHLMNAISLDNISVTGARILLVPVAGYIMERLGTESGTSVILGTRIAFCILALVWLQRLVAPPTPKRARQPFWRELGEGLRYSSQHKAVFSLQFLFIIPLILLMPMQNVLLPAFADDVLHIGVGGLGLLQGVAGAGSVIGLLFIAFIGNFKGKGRLFFVLAVTQSVFFLMFASSRWVALSFPLLLLAMSNQNSKDAVWNTMMQTNIPDEVRGRVMSIRETMRGFMPLGGLMMGALADAVGPAQTLAVLAAIHGAVLLTAAFLLPNVRKLE